MGEATHLEGSHSVIKVYASLEWSAFRSRGLAADVHEGSNESTSTCLKAALAMPMLRQKEPSSVR